MSQVAVDYAVPEDGPRTPQEFAGDINEILAAIVSVHSGTTAPPSPVTGMQWLDTSGSPSCLLKRYNGTTWVIEVVFNTTSGFGHQVGGGGVATLASAGTTSLGTVFYASISITGTTTITSFGTSAYPGEIKFLTFAGALTLTHNGTSLIIPGGANITTVAGDCAIVQDLGSNNWKVLAYIPLGSPNLVGLPTVASATTTNLGSVATQALIVSGTTTITGFGTVAAGTIKFVTFSGALLLTHNGTSLIMPNGANITTVAGDVGIFESLGSGNWRCLNYFSAMTQLGTGLGSIASASTTNLGSLSNPAISITGTTTITSLGSTAPVGTVKYVTFAGALTLTHNGTSLILPDGVNITTVAGDSMIVECIASGNWRVLSYEYVNQQIFRDFQTIASATTTDLGSVSASAITISGTTTITGFGSTAAVGAVKFVHFSGALTLTHNGTSLILHGGSNITTAAGDTAVFMHVSSGNWRCLTWTPAGATVETGIGTIASATTTDLGSSPRQSLNITGTTTITGFGSSAATGSIRLLTFAGILQITYNATSMITPFAANITTAAGDSALVQHLGSGNWKILVYQSGSTVAIADGSITNAKLADMATLTIKGNNTGGTTAPLDLTASQVRTLLALVIGTNVQAWDATLDSFAALAVVSGDIFYGSGSNTVGRLGIGTNGYFLTVVSGLPAWASYPTLVSLEGLSLVSGDILYATAADTLARLPKGTDGQMLELASGIPSWKNQEEIYGFAISDEATSITTGTAKLTVRPWAYAFTITSVRACLSVVSTSGIPTVDINEAGVTILSTKLTIDANEKTSVTAATAAVISDASIAADAEITFDIDVAGTGAKGLKVFITGRKT